MKYNCCSACGHAGSARCVDCEDGNKFLTNHNVGSLYIAPARRNGKSQYMSDMMRAYITSDTESMENIYRNMVRYPYGANLSCIPQIKDVIFNPPATIVFWADGTKTVVKCQDEDIYDPEKGLAMAISKKALGNQGNYYNGLKKWLGKYEDTTAVPPMTIDWNNCGSLSISSVAECLRKLTGSKED